jgi:hypothetical protein
VRGVKADQPLPHGHGSVSPFLSRARKQAVVLAFVSATAFAHVGSPDVFFQGNAGPYPLLVTIRPPDVIPGVARIEVRSLAPGVEKIELTPTPMTGIASTHPPVADVAQRVAGDTQSFEGALWLMSVGSWEVHIRASGPKGTGELPVPVPAVALRMQPMSRGVSYFLLGMMALLAVGIVAIVGAGVREATLDPEVPAKRWSRKTTVAMACASAVVIAALWGGNAWWVSDAATYSQRIYKPLGITATLNQPDQLQLRVTDPGWLKQRRLDDLIPDHGHLMHLFLVRWPAMDRIAHLHPEQTATGFFETRLPSLPAGTYRVYGDIVHESGFAETAIGELALPNVDGKPVTGDDAEGPTVFETGYKMVWVHGESKPVIAKQVALFSFEIVGLDGKPASNLEPYMGMGGHAEFIKDDGSVFAHLHPTGSVPMASVAVASPAAMIAMHETSVGPVVSFPYGIPTVGQYKIFVQLKRAGKVVTGAFDVTVI